MSSLDEYDLERSHELERRLDRDEEREASGYHWARRRRLHFARPAVANTIDAVTDERRAA